MATEEKQLPLITIAVHGLQASTDGPATVCAGRLPLSMIELDIFSEDDEETTGDAASLFGSKHVHLDDVMRALEIRWALPEVLEALASALSALQGETPKSVAFDKAQTAFDRLRQVTDA